MQKKRQAECEQIATKARFSVSRALHPMTVTSLHSLHLDPPSPPLPTYLPHLTPSNCVSLQINKHYQRVTDYGLAEAASVCYSSGRSVSIAAWARRPGGMGSFPGRACDTESAREKGQIWLSGPARVQRRTCGSPGIHSLSVRK